MFAENIESFFLIVRGKQVVYFSSWQMIFWSILKPKWIAKSRWWKSAWLFSGGWQSNDYGEINEALGAVWVGQAIIDGHFLPAMHSKLKNNYWTQTFRFSLFDLNELCIYQKQQKRLIHYDKIHIIWITVKYFQTSQLLLIQPIFS